MRQALSLFVSIVSDRWIRANKARNPIAANNTAKNTKPLAMRRIFRARRAASSSSAAWAWREVWVAGGANHFWQTPHEISPSIWFVSSVTCEHSGQVTWEICFNTRSTMFASASNQFYAPVICCLSSMKLTGFGRNGICVTGSLAGSTGSWRWQIRVCRSAGFPHRNSSNGKRPPKKKGIGILHNSPAGSAILNHCLKSCRSKTWWPWPVRFCRKPAIRFCKSWQSMRSRRRVTWLR